MWMRLIESLLGLYIALSPFLFSYPKEAKLFWISDLLSGLLIFFFSFICLFKTQSKLHFLNLILAVWFIFAALSLKDPIAAAVANYMITGLIVFMLSILPTNSHEPPKKWRDFLMSKNTLFR